MSKADMETGLSRRLFNPGGVPNIALDVCVVKQHEGLTGGVQPSDEETHRWVAAIARIRATGVATRQEALHRSPSF